MSNNVEVMNHKPRQLTLRGAPVWAERLAQMDEAAVSFIRNLPENRKEGPPRADLHFDVNDSNIIGCFVLKDSGRVKDVINRDVPSDYFEKESFRFIGPVRNFEKPKRDQCVTGL
jgi:hypothetical protein